jgi:AAA domain
MGTFKTFVAIDLAVAVMSGQPFIGFPIKRRGGVLFIAAEGQQEVAIRLQAAVEARYAKAEHAPFAWSETCPRLLDKTAGQELAAMAKEATDGLQARFALPLALIVIDTIGRSAGYEKSGDENDAATGFKIMKVMSTLSARTGAFVLGVERAALRRRRATSTSCWRCSATRTSAGPSPKPGYARANAAAAPTARNFRSG